MDRSTAAIRLLAGVKEPVRLASTANLALAGLLTIDGVVSVSGDRVLVKDQTSAIENGIYTVSEGVWRRAPDSGRSNVMIAGMKIVVSEGDDNAGSMWNLDTHRPVIGEDEIEFSIYLLGGLPGIYSDLATIDFVENFAFSYLIPDKAVTLPKMYHPTVTSRLLGIGSVASQVITGTGVGGGGSVRLTVPSTAAFATSEKKIVEGVVGTTEANGRWTISVVDATHIDLQGSTYANAYVSGGTIGGGIDELTLTQILDFIGSATRGDILYRGATTWGRKALGAANTMLRSDGTDLVYGGDNFGSRLLHVQYNIASGSNGGALPGGVDNAYAKRTISTALTNEITGASLASSQITLPAGTYIFDAEFMGFDTSVTARGRLRNVTDGTTTLNGMSARASGTATSVKLGVKGKFTIAAQKVFEIQHWPGGGAAQAGAQGQPASTGEVEVYLDAMIWKTA